MMKKLLLLIALLLLALPITAQETKKGPKEEPKINVGIKGAHANRKQACDWD